MNNFNELWSTLKKDKERLDTCIIESAKSPVDLSNQVSNYVLSNGGKRIRPLVLLLLARAMGCEGGGKYQLATAIEFIHTATLLHDDVVDESHMRRNHPTANHQFGNSAAILVGDFLYTRAFQLIAKEPKAVEIISEATNQLTMGEIMQLMNVNNLSLSEADYFQIINLKTAVLFAAACRFSSLLAKRVDLSKDCEKYGKHLGIAFQIADDVLDYVGDTQKIGKNIGDDLAEKKMTLPLIHALENANEGDKAQLKRIIKNGEIDKIDIVINILNSTNSIQYTLDLAHHHADLAKFSLSSLPETEYKKHLSKLADITVKRVG